MKQLAIEQVLLLLEFALGKVLLPPFCRPLLLLQGFVCLLKFIGIRRVGFFEFTCWVTLLLYGWAPAFLKLSLAAFRPRFWATHATVLAFSLLRCYYPLNGDLLLLALLWAIELGLLNSPDRLQHLEAEAKQLRDFFERTGACLLFEESQTTKNAECFAITREFRLDEAIFAALDLFKREGRRFCRYFVQREDFIVLELTQGEECILGRLLASETALVLDPLKQRVFQDGTGLASCADRLVLAATLLKYYRKEVSLDPRTPILGIALLLDRFRGKSKGLAFAGLSKLGVKVESACRLLLALYHLLKFFLQHPNVEGLRLQTQSAKNVVVLSGRKLRSSRLLGPQGGELGRTLLILGLDSFKYKMFENFKRTELQVHVRKEGDTTDFWLQDLEAKCERILRRVGSTQASADIKLQELKALLAGVSFAPSEQHLDPKSILQLQEEDQKPEEKPVRSSVKVGQGLKKGSGVILMSTSKRISSFPQRKPEEKEHSSKNLGDLSLQVRQYLEQAYARIFKEHTQFSPTLR